MLTEPDYLQTLVCDGRHKLGISQLQFGARIGVSKDTISGWEHGQRPLARSLSALAQELDLPLDVLKAAQLKIKSPRANWPQSRLARHDKSGQTFGGYLVLRSDDIRPNQTARGHYWWCQCLNCGKECSVGSQNLCKPPSKHTLKGCQTCVGKRMQKHGTASRYMAGGCRCEPCKTANTIWVQKYRKLRAARLGATDHQRRAARQATAIQ